MRYARNTTPAQEHSADDHFSGPAELSGADAGLFSFGHALSEQRHLGNAAVAERLGQAANADDAGWDLTRWLFGDEQEESPALSIEDATEAQLAPVAEAVAGARGLAATGLAVLSAGPQSERHAQLLNAHFHSQDPALLDQALAGLAQTQAGLSGAVEVEVEAGQLLYDRLTSDEEALGYVYRNVLTGRGAGAIHLTPAFFEQSPADRAATMLHEATHMWAGTEDHAYKATADYSALSAEEAIENADSYASFCQLHQADIDQIEATASKAQAQAAAQTHAAALWQAYQDGAITLWQDGFTTPDGVALDSQQVGEAISAHFRAVYPEHCQEAVTKLGADPGASLSFPDGVALRPDLTRGIDADPAEGWCG